MRANGAVDVRERVRTQEQGIVLIIEIGDEEIWHAIVVDIASVDAHTGFGQTGRIVSYLGIKSYVLKHPVPVVDKKQIRRGIARDKKIWPAIVVGVNGHHS